MNWAKWFLNCETGAGVSVTRITGSTMTSVTRVTLPDTAVVTSFGRLVGGVCGLKPQPSQGAEPGKEEEEGETTETTAPGSDALETASLCSAEMSTSPGSRFRLNFGQGSSRNFSSSFF